MYRSFRRGRRCYWFRLSEYSNSEQDFDSRLDRSDLHIDGK
jgi:hypothetical protein